MAAQAAVVEVGQLGLYDGRTLQDTPARTARALTPSRPAQAPEKPLCAGCRAREARYGFRDVGAEAAAREDRPRTLCFECFRMELDHRQRVTAQLARGWNAEQAQLPLADTLRQLTTRRRRAQIAARHALAEEQAS